MPRLTRYAVPHLWGTLDYSALAHADGDTIHLRNPVLLMNGRVVRPERGVLEVASPGRKPRMLELRGNPPSYLLVRLSGIDAPESSYISTIRPNPNDAPYRVRAGRRVAVCQPHHEPAVTYILGVAARWPKLLVEIDPDVMDRRGRVLGFVFASDAHADRHTFISLELVRRGLAFPYVFESAGDYRPRLLDAGARARRARRGVWRHYVDEPLAYTKSAWPAVAARDGTIVPTGSLNHPNSSAAWSRPASSRATTSATPSEATKSSIMTPATSFPATSTGGFMSTAAFGRRTGVDSSGAPTMNTYLAVDPTELKLALALAETTIEGMEDLLPDVVLERVRRDLQGKLLWTAWGREQIAGYLGTWS